MNRVLVTGATGFVGRVLCAQLAAEGYLVRAALHRKAEIPGGAVEWTNVGEVSEHTEWSQALRGVTTVVHLAARVHIRREGHCNSELYFRTNAYGTERLAVAAAQSGVKRIVFLSTIKVNGEESSGRPYTSADPPGPIDAYGKSKWAAEKALADVAKRTGVGMAIVRSPLVYGPEVRANFFRMLRWVDREWPLPIAAIDNRRSLVSVWNLCDLLVRAVNVPAAMGGTWLVSDGEDISTAELFRRLARAMNRRARLMAVPTAVLRCAASLAGRPEEMRRLCGSLAVDISATRASLGWSPPVPMVDALARTVSWYLGQRGNGGA